MKKVLAIESRKPNCFGTSLKIFCTNVSLMNHHKGGGDAGTNSGLGRVDQAIQKIPAEPASLSPRSATTVKENVFPRSRSLFRSDSTSPIPKNRTKMFLNSADISRTNMW
jgi:hypothetical protein